MIINIHKPIGWTSFEVVKKIRYITGEKKVGHGGTLDPFAEGVLIIGTGKDTKALSKFIDNQKQYEACINLGDLTDTYDIEGKIIKNMNITVLSEKKIKNVLNTFLGEINQVPPMFSAKKINGKRLYDLARKNITIKRDPVKICIYAIKLLSYSQNTISFSVRCSKGTYIRVLGKEIAERLGTVGYLKTLVRTKVGNYTIKDSTTITNFQNAWKSLKN